MKKIITIKLIAELEIDSDYYVDKNDNTILEVEKENFDEWLAEMQVFQVISTEFSIRDVK